MFRVVNLPTVPGDLLAGAAAVCLGAVGYSPGMHLSLAYAVGAAVLMYMYGLADNDIVGAATDKGRPIPDGEISMKAAKTAAAVCLVAVAAVGLLGRLAVAWWIVAAILAGCIIIYNRKKWWWLMGVCRGLNVICGGAAVAGETFCRSGDLRGRLALLAVASVWTLYIAAVTKYSEGEELDEEKKRRVGMLIGALIYLQLAVLIVFPVTKLLVAGAVLLIILRLAKRLMPEVSAS